MLPRLGRHTDGPTGSASADPVCEGDGQITQESCSRKTSRPRQKRLHPSRSPTQRALERISSTKAGTTNEAKPYTPLREPMPDSACLEIELDGVCPACRIDGLDEARRRMDLPGRANGDEKVAVLKRFHDGVQVSRHLAEPHHIGPQAAGMVAGWTCDVGAELLTPRPARAAPLAQRTQKLAMHMKQVAGAGTLVQVVHILGDEQHVARPSRLELRQSEMGSVGAETRIEELSAPDIIEAVDELRVAGERFGRRDILGSMALPEAAGATEDLKPGLGGDPGSRQNDDQASRFIAGIPLHKTLPDRTGGAGSIWRTPVAPRRHRALAPRAGLRTSDPAVNSRLLYQLSYRGSPNAHGPIAELATRIHPCARPGGPGRN